MSNIKCKCEVCGVEYEKPEDYKKWNETHPNVFFKWSLQFCDEHRKQKELEALKQLPKVIDALSSSVS